MKFCFPGFTNEIHAFIQFNLKQDLPMTLLRGTIKMTYKEIDALFPFVVFGYGLVMTFVLHTPYLFELAENRLPPQLLQQFRAHRGLGLLCLIVGGIWSLQNIWYN